MAVKDIKNIGDGWLNFMKSCIRRRSLSPELSREIEKRSEICSTCPMLSVKTIRGFVAMGKCESCGCCFPMIIYARNKKCPDGKWDSIPCDIIG